MTQGDRIRKARKKAKLTQEALASETGIGRVTIAQLENNTVKSIDGAKMVRLCSVLNISAEWLLSGKGQMEPAAVAETSANYISRQPVVYRYPLIPWEKIGRHTDADVIERIPNPFELSPLAFVVKMPDNSMQTMQGQSIPEGMLLFIDPDEDPAERVSSHRTYVLARLESGEHIVREYKRSGGATILEALNPAYPPMAADAVRILGTIRQMATDFR